MTETATRYSVAARRTLSGSPPLLLSSPLLSTSSQLSSESVGPTLLILLISICRRMLAEERAEPALREAVVEDASDAAEAQLDAAKASAEHNITAAVTLLPVPSIAQI